MEGIARRSPFRGRDRIRTALLIAAAFAMLGPLALTSADGAEPVGLRALTRTNPDVVFILTDDQRTDTLLSMPSVRRLLVDQGTRFTRHSSRRRSAVRRAPRSSLASTAGTGVWENGGGTAASGRSSVWATSSAPSRSRCSSTAIAPGWWQVPQQLRPLRADGPQTARLEPFRGIRLPTKSGAYYDYRIGQRGDAYGKAP
jgi:hypothetical protein